MSTTPRLALTELTASQAQKEVTANTDFWMLDALVQSVIQDKDLTAPPVGPASGACYIVASVASGAWTGKEKYLAQYRNAAWVFFAPFEGLTVFAADENVYLLYDGAAWVLMGVGLTGADHGALTGLADDDHTQYPLLAGRAGGQTVIGGPGATDDLNLSSTRHVVLQGAGGNVGIGVLLPSYALSLAGNAARTIGAERNADAGGAGQTLTITAGGAKSGETNKAGGDLILASGISTGSGSADIQFQATPLGGSGTTDHTPVTMLTLKGTRELILQSNVGYSCKRSGAITSVGQAVGIFNFVTNNGVTQALILGIAEGSDDTTPNVGFAFRTGASATNKVVISAIGNLGLGVLAGGFGTNAVRVFAIGAGIAPITGPADIVQCWAADQAAGNCCLWWRTENGAVGKLYQLSHVEDAVVAHAITAPADSPADADALRDDLVTNTIPAMNAALDALGAKINAAYSSLEALGFHATA